MKLRPQDVFPSCQPVLEVPDVPRAIDYYREVLGFELDFAVGDPPTYACVGRAFCRDGAAAFLRFTEWLRDKPEVVNSGWLAIYVDSIDTLYQEYSDRGARISQELGDRKWGMREFEIRDGDGHYLRFGSMIVTHDESVAGAP